MSVNDSPDVCITVGSVKETELTMLGTTSINFNYGFSIKKPTSMGDTTNRPVPGENIYKLIVEYLKTNIYYL